MPLTNHNATKPATWHWTDAEISRALSATNQAASLFMLPASRQTTVLAAGLHLHTITAMSREASNMKRLDFAMKAVEQYLHDRETKTERATQCRS